MQEQNNKQFYISDWHYGHANVIAFDNRPFKSLLEMDEALVEVERCGFSGRHRVRSWRYVLV